LILLLIKPLPFSVSFLEEEQAQGEEEDSVHNDCCKEFQSAARRSARDVNTIQLEAGVNDPRLQQRAGSRNRETL
jgi:hypothetical protein